MPINLASADLSYAAAWRKVALPTPARTVDADQQSSSTASVDNLTLNPTGSQMETAHDNARSTGTDAFLQEIGYR